MLPNFPEDLIESAPMQYYRACAIQSKTRRSFNQICDLRSAKASKQSEIQELKIQFETISNGLALIRREIATLEPLVKVASHQKPD